MFVPKGLTAAVRISSAADEEIAVGIVVVLDAALAITTRVGATWDAARVRGRLRRLGVRHRPSA
jgi:hypothetical protein